jgi:ADP-ribosylglycohydrolase
VCQSSGYVIHTLEASIWCLLTSKSYSEAVLKAVNLGSDTDTTAAVTGALAGLFWHFNTIPNEWRLNIARHNDIMNLCTSLKNTLTRKS